MRTTKGRVGVAISTTGHEHRLRFLETCVKAWGSALAGADSLFVTVDGSAEDTQKVAHTLRHCYGVQVYRVGQINPGWGIGPVDDLIGDRLGVATNKNTGLELLMDTTEAEHLFLSDDDCWPLYPESLSKHIDLQASDAQWHSMVCWGGSRLDAVDGRMAYWTWPRGVMLYSHRSAVEQIGGMDERFGYGGHEHVEWSNRMFNAGFSRQPFVSPASYATRNSMGARALWHCEDMIRPGEPRHEHNARRLALTSIDRKSRDWDKINRVFASHEGDAGYVTFRAHQNGRGSATLSSNLMSRGAEGQA